MLDALTLDQLRVFAAVADAGSFRAAARQLSRVQSAVSHAIANMESELGVSLFDRQGRRPVMTPQGQALLANARDILLRVDAMRARAQGLGEGVELELPLVVDTLFPIAHVGAALCRMRAAYPSVAPRVTVLPLGGRSPPCWTAATPWASSPASISATRASRCRRCPRCRWWRWSAPAMRWPAASSPGRCWSRPSWPTMCRSCRPMPRR